LLPCYLHSDLLKSENVTKLFEECSEQLGSVVSKTEVPYSFAKKDDPKAHLQRPSFLHPLGDNGPGNSVKARLNLLTETFYVVMVKIFITYSIVKSMQFIQTHF
jgi:hypothetical protein